MDLSKFLPRRETVAVPTQNGTEELTVYGLEFESICVLVDLNRPLLEALFLTVTEQSAAEPLTMEALIAKCLAEGPALVAAIIAFGARQPDAMEQCRELPPVVQFEAVDKILRLTAEGDYGPKKVMATVTALLKKPSADQAASENGGTTSVSA